jgi:glucokinase
LAIGIDVGATKLLAAVVDAKGRASHIVQVATPAAEGPKAILGSLVAVVKKCGEAAGGTLGSIGIGFAGQVSRGVVLASPNLAGWNHVPLAAPLRRRFGVPVVLTNDARAAAWGESRYGHGGATRNLVFLSLGTGIGAGVVSDGVLLQGARGSAGELGHVPVVAGGRTCSCGGRGCLEAYAGGWALAKAARHAVRADPRAGRVLLSLAGSAARIDARTLARACAAGDALSKRMVAQAGRILGVACAGVANAFNPEVLVLGGGLVQGFPRFVADARRGVTASLAPARHVRVVRTRLGNAAVAIGAADLGRAPT